MTCAMVWLGEEDGIKRMWAASDSRISAGSSHESRSIMLDIFPKISSIPIKICPWGMLTNAFPREVASIGFAFAGSTLFANSVKEVLAYLLASLKPLDEAERLRNTSGETLEKEIAGWNQLHPLNDSVRRTLPSMAEFAELAVDVTQQVLTSNAVHQGGTRGSSSFLIFGHCFQKQEFRCFCIEHKAGHGEFHSKEISLSTEPFELAIIGDHHSEIGAEVLSHHDENEGILRSRAPLSVLKRLIQENTYLSIGGYVQLAQGTPYGVSVMGTWNPGKEGSRYFGYRPHRTGADNVTELRTVGRFLISPPTMIA